VVFFFDCWEAKSANGHGRGKAGSGGKKRGGQREQSEGTRGRAHKRVAEMSMCRDFSSASERKGADMVYKKEVGARRGGSCSQRTGGLLEFLRFLSGEELRGWSSFSFRRQWGAFLSAKTPRRRSGLATN